MSDENAPDAGQTNDDRERRLQALRSLAQTHPQPGVPIATAPGRTASPTPPARRDRRDEHPLVRHPAASPPFNGLAQYTPARRSPWLALAAGTIIVALLATLGAVFLRGASTGPATPPHAIHMTPQVDGVACPSGAAISPDGSAIAIVGYQRQCPDSDLDLVNEPGMAVIYETTKGRAVATVTLALDTLAKQIGVPLLAQLPSNLPPLHSYAYNNPVLVARPTILYGVPTWSPDGKRIAIPFVVRPVCFCEVEAGNYTFTESGAPTQVGLLELTSAGQLSAVLSASYRAAWQSVEWDTRQRTLVSTGDALPLAQTYAWNGAQVSASSPLGAKATLGPIGAAPGATSFSLWETGWGGAVYQQVNLTPNTYTFTRIPSVYTLTPTLAAWSPDGRYLLIPNFSTLVVTLPGAPQPTASALQTASLSHAPHIVARDAALTSLYSRIQVQQGLDTMPYALAWSPDGSLLAAAVALDSPLDPVPVDQSVTVLDTRTGKTVATFSPAASPQNTLASNPATLAPTFLEIHPQLAWSSDGSRLFLLNPTLGTITVWRVKS